MAKIKEIKLTNFKFFPKEFPAIKVDSKHVLIFGENGSGKSSLFWALYTLLESANKEDVNEIKKYFDPSKSAHLTNIKYLPKAAGWPESSIQFLLDDAANTIFKTSEAGFEAPNINDGKESNIASDFINYKALYRIHDFKHQDDIDLFSYFDREVFPYLNISTSVNYYKNIGGTYTSLSTSDASKISKYIKDGLKKDIPYDATRFRFPYANERSYKAFVIAEESFKTGIDRIIENLNVIIQTDKVLKNKFDLDIDFHLEFSRVKPFEYKGGVNGYYRPPVYKISFIIDSYLGQTYSIPKPHSFLNEAKLTAIGLSLRFALLKSRLNTALLKILALDDLLISLDMSNREVVLKYFIDDYGRDYQLFIFSHDKSFFDLTKRLINQKKEDKKWVFLELFEDENKKEPVILPSETYYSKGLYHLDHHDYPASGNYFRKAAEEMFENEFPREVKIGDDGQQRASLKNYIDAAINLYKRFGEDLTLLNSLDNYVYLLLNPLSHRAVEENIYKLELKKVKELLPKIIDEVRNKKIKEVVAQNSDLIIYFKQSADIEQEYLIHNTNPIYHFQRGASTVMSTSKCKSSQSITINKGAKGIPSKNTHYDGNSLEEIHKKIFTFKGVAYDNSMMDNISVWKKNQNLKIKLRDLV